MSAGRVGAIGRRAQGGYTFAACVMSPTEAHPRWTRGTDLQALVSTTEARDNASARDAAPRRWWA